MLDSIGEIDVGCHLSIHFVGVLAFADDLNLLSTTLSGLIVLVCEKYADEYSISFNDSKNRLSLFRARQCNIHCQFCIVKYVRICSSSWTSCLHQ